MAASTEFLFVFKLVVFSSWILIENIFYLPKIYKFVNKRPKGKFLCEFLKVIGLNNSVNKRLSC